MFNTMKKECGDFKPAKEIEKPRSKLRGPRLQPDVRPIEQPAIFPSLRKKNIILVAR
jgi:hypothetical protein